MISRSIPFRTALPLLALAGLLGACGGCGEDPPETASRLHRPNLLWISVDTLRADHLGCYGYFRDTSPNIDALAERSILFERCVVPMATTLPSHLSVLTGTYPLEHGVLANVTQGGERFVPSPILESAAEVLGEAGYDTAAFISAKPLQPWTGIDAGFARFDGPAGNERRAKQTVDLALEWLAGRTGKQPYFLWVHLFDPHGPFEPPAAYRGRFQGDEQLDAYLAERRFAERSTRPTGAVIETRPGHDAYDAEILYTDSQVGRLLAAVEAAGAEETAIVFFSDHGEGLGQHGEPGHGLVWDEQVHAALFVHLPGEAPRRVATPVSSVDVFPTLFGRVEVPGIERFLARASGVDVLAAAFLERPVLSQTSARLEQFGKDPVFALSLGRWKLIAGGEREALYDLAADPFELEDVAAAHPEVVARLAKELERIRAAQQERGALFEAGELGELDEETLKGLEDLGYTGKR